MWPLPVAREGAENVFAAQLSVPPNEWRLLLSGTIYRAVIEVHAPGRFHLLLFGDVEYEQFRSTGVPDPYGTCLKRTGYVKFDFQTTQPDLGAHVVLANPNNHAMFAGFSCRTADKLDYFPHGADWRP